MVQRRNRWKKHNFNCIPGTLDAGFKFFMPWPPCVPVPMPAHLVVSIKAKWLQTPWAHCEKPIPILRVPGIQNSFVIFIAHRHQILLITGSLLLGIWIFHKIIHVLQRRSWSFHLCNASPQHSACSNVFTLSFWLHRTEWHCVLCQTLHFDSNNQIESIGYLCVTSSLFLAFSMAWKWNLHLLKCS